MRFYNKQHKHYCGIDLHAKSMYICIQDQNGKILVHKNIRTSPEYFLKVIKEVHYIERFPRVQDFISYSLKRKKAFQIEKFLKG